MNIGEYLNIYGTTKFSILSYSVLEASAVHDYSEISLPKLNLSTYDLCYYSLNKKLTLVEITCESYEQAISWVKAILLQAERIKVPLLWCMFDGAFGSCNECFTDWQMHQIYAIFLEGFESKYCFEVEKIASDDWRAVLLKGKRLFENLTMASD